MLKYNTFRPHRYLRSLFTEGRYFLAQEASDLELELYDYLRKSLKNNIGDIAISNAWKVSRYSATQLLVSPGEAWQNGLLFELRTGQDWLLSTGILPAGVTISDAPNGTGKLITFTNTTSPSDNYRVVITATEQIIDSTSDPFLQNVNIPEPTGSKIRLLYSINVVSASNQGVSPNYDTTSTVPYATDIGAASAVNLSNTISIIPSNTAGYLISAVPTTGSAQIDGRTIELTIKNPVGANPFPIGTNDQAEFSNGTLIDANGNEYHINAIFQGISSDLVVIRLSQEVGQPTPVIPNIAGSPSGFVPYYLNKKDVYYTDDTTGAPTGKYYWHIAQATWDTANGFVHSSVVSDLRNRVISESSFEDLTNLKFSLKLTGGGIISLGTDAQTLSWNNSFSLINPAGSVQTIASSAATVLVDGGTLTYVLNTAGGAIERGTLATSVTSNTGSVVKFTNSPTPSLSQVRVGNVIKVGSQTTYITAIDDATISGGHPNKNVTVATAITNTGAATIYLDSFGPGTAALTETTYTLAVLSNGKVVVGDILNLGAGESNTVYDERVQIQNSASPYYDYSLITGTPPHLPANSSITLPVNSVNGLPQYYDSVRKKLMVFQNQLMKFQGSDWISVDQHTIQFNYDLPLDTEIHFRIETFPAGSVGGGSTDTENLQSAYDNGNTIVTNTGSPFTVSGTASKVAAFLGDISVTGIIDPKGIQFIPESSNPLAGGQKGLWTNSTNDLVYEGNSEVNITQSIADLESGAVNPITASHGAVKLGNDIQVVSAPSVSKTVTLGETLTANTSYVLRWALNGETSGAVYKANAANASLGHYYGIGLFSSASVPVATSQISIVTNGTYNLASGDTPFSASDLGKAVFLTNDGTGSFTTSPTAIVGDAQFRIGIVQTTTSIWVDIKDLSGVVPEPVYDQRRLFPAGLAASTTITIPVNSRNGSIQETYSAAGGDLKVFVNQLFKFQGIDWTAVSATQISFPYDLPNDAEVHFRKEQLASGILMGGGGGGSGTLQDAYNNGQTITTVSGTPVVINGPSGQKLLHIAGDLQVDGVVDPTAIQLTTQSSNPLSAGQHGIWIDNSGNLIQQQPSSSTNITQVINNVIAGLAQTIIANTYSNTTGSNIPIATPVYAPTAGHIDLADGTNSTKFRVIGVTTEAINNGASGSVAYTGYLTGIGGLTHGKYIYLGLTPGTLVDVPPTLGPYPVGFEVIKIGVMDGANLVLQIQYMGSL